MRMTLQGDGRRLLLAVIGACGDTRPVALRRTPDAACRYDIAAFGLAHSGRRANFPLAKRATLGSGKSLLVQFPFELKDVLVADPDKVDAVVQSSNRVFLIAKKVRAIPTPSSSIPRVSRS